MNMTATDHDLLRQFASDHTEDAFAALVNRHLPLVYSAALRQVRRPQLAEDVCQSVFTRLASTAASLDPDTVLTAWLYRVTRNAAIDLVRQEVRRKSREQLALEMSDTNDPSHGWSHVEPLLDEAIHCLGEEDRTAVLLRFFENKSLREVGEALGASEDAAQKRVGRALERLREHLSNRHVNVGAAGLAALLSTHAIQAAPVGLAGSVAVGAFVASAAPTAAGLAAVTHSIVMTTIQKTIVIVVATGAVAAGLHQALQASKLRKEVQALRQQNQEHQQVQGALLNQVEVLEQRRDRASNELVDVSRELAAIKKNPTEIHKLRGEVGRLRRENADITSSSPLSKVTANPEAVKLLREQQKMGMGVIYRGFSKDAKLTPEQTQNFNDLLADHIMENVNHVTTALRDKPSSEQMNGVFAAQEAALDEEVRALLGDDGLAEYKDYTRQLLSKLSADQFKGMLTGSATIKEEKANQFSRALQESVQEVLASEGLPKDYQALPILNFRNIASEQEGERALKILDDIYQRASARGNSFLSAEELAKFNEFRSTAIANSRAALALNRSMMSPLSD